MLRAAFYKYFSSDFCCHQVTEWKKLTLQLNRNIAFYVPEIQILKAFMSPV